MYSSLLVFAVAAAANAADLPDPESWLAQAEVAYDNVTRYTAIVHKQQRVAGELLPEETIFLKFKKPFSLYMKWIEEPYRDSELLYVIGWNDNRVRAHRGGFFRFVTRDLDPTDPALMKGNLRPVTDIGIGQLVTLVARNIRKAVETGQFGFVDRGEETLYGRTTRVIDVTFPTESVNEYDGYRFVINQDAESKILIRIRVYDQNDQMTEDYGYENLDLDARLTDADFTPEYPGYRF